MGLYCKFDVIEDFGFPDKLEDNQFGIVVEVDYSDGCDAFVSSFLSHSQGTVPVDTGYLQSTLEAETDGTTCECSTDCEYAQYVEYGTWCMSAQPYFEPSIKAALQEAEPIWRQSLEEAQEQFQEEVEAAQEQQMAAMGRAGGSGGSGGMGLGQLLGGLLLAMVVLAVVTIAKEFIKDTFGRGSGGSVFMPEIEIT